MFKVIIVTIVLPLTVCDENTMMNIPPRQIGEGPGGMEYNDSTSCDDFVKQSKFNPYSVTGEPWIAFYYWAPDNTAPVLTFFSPTEKERNYMKQLFDSTMSQPVNWTARHLVMKDLTDNSTSLIVERSVMGYFWLFLYVRIEQGVRMDPADIRFKQTGDSKYLAIMHCEKDTVYVLARKQDIPDRSRIHDEIAKIGYRGRGGRSYLYQGHRWMPIPEMDPQSYWGPKKVDPWLMRD